MNKLRGVIAEIESEGQLSLVRVHVADTTFASLVIDTPVSAPYLKAGTPVWVVFRENEVVVAKSFSGLISMQNRLDGTVSNIRTGKLLCSLDIVSGLDVPIVSVITARSAALMSLAVGDQVTALIKTNEISLQPYD